MAANGMIARLTRGQPVPYQFGSSNDFYQAALPSQESGFWVIVNGGLRLFRDGRWQSDLGNYPGAESPVTVLLETRNGAVLVGTLNDGLFVILPGGSPLHFSRTNGLSHDWVRALCEDHEGNVWIGTGAGMDSLRARKVKMVNAPDGWQGRAVLSFAIDGDAAWIGTEGAGLYHYDGNRWSTFNESSGLANLFVWSVLETRARSFRWHLGRRIARKTWRSV
jgi:ligand-binding sensor domain-containing protein